MPKDFRATTLERAIGRSLAAWRNERGFSLTEAGMRVGFSSAQLSTMENAVQPSTPVDIMALGYAYRVPTSEWQAVVLQAQHAERKRSNLRRVELLDPAADFASLAFEATWLRVFTTDLVPAVFHLADYTNAAMRADDPVRAARWASLREACSTRLTEKDPLVVQAVFPEAVLRQVVGGPRVMKAQLLRLMEISEHPTVTVQVVSRGAGAYPAMGAPFTLLSFPHRQHNDVGYLETFLKGEYVEEPGLIEQCTQRFSSLQSVARPVPIIGNPWPGVPARGRNASGRADASWLPVAPGLTPHGLRHTHKTLMVELHVPKPLQDERIGHLDGTVQGRYSHVTQTMRDQLMADLTEVWEQALKLRQGMSPGSPVLALDKLLNGA